MNPLILVNEESQGYDGIHELNDALEGFLDSLNKEYKSNSLEEDLDYLSKKCMGYNQKELVKLYQKLIKQGFYRDSKYIFIYSLENQIKLIRCFVKEKLSEISFLSKEGVDNDLINNIVDNIIDANKDLKENYEMIFINSQNIKIFYSKLKDFGDILNIYKYLSNHILLNFYEKNLFNQGLSKLSMENYLIDIRVFLRWLNKNSIMYGKIDRRIAKVYLSYILKDRKVNSYNKILCSLSNFNRFLVKIGALDQLFFIYNRDLIKDLTKKSVDVFTFEEQKIIESVLENELLSQRLDLMVALLYYTGIRITELVSMELKNIDIINKELTVIGKGKKRRSIPLKKILIKKINTYIQGDRKKSKMYTSKYLIVSQRSYCLAREVATRKIKVLNKYLDCRVYPHKFRHNFATMLVNKGVRINVVAEILGHSNIQTTIDYYVNTSKKDKRQAIDLI